MELEMDDDDILIIQDINRPNQPPEDPLEVNQYNCKETENIINLESSDDEVYEKARTEFMETATVNSFNGTILHSCLQDLNTPNDRDMIDLDVEYSDPLAALKYQKEKKIKSNQTIYTIKKVSNNKSDPHPASLVRNKLDPPLVDCSKARLEKYKKNLEDKTTANKSSNKFDFSCDQGKDMQGPNQNILAKGLFIGKASTTDTSVINISDSNAVDESSHTLKQSYSSKHVNPSEPPFGIHPITDNSCGNSKISGKPNQPIQPSLHNIINKLPAPFVIPFQPQEMKSTVLGLNLNINNEGSVSNQKNTLVNTLCQSQKTLNILNRDDQKELASNTTGNSYYCDLCSFKTTDMHLIQTHLCSVFSSTRHTKQMPTSFHQNNIKGDYKKLGNLYCCNLCSFKTVDSEVMKGHAFSHYNEKDQRLRSNSIGNTYCCVVCAFQTSDLQVMNTHLCTLGNRVLTNNIKNPIRNKKSEHVDVETPAEKSCIEAELSKNKSVQENMIDNSLQASLEKTYCCVACAFQTSYFEAMRSHVCPSEQKSTNTVNIQSVDDMSITPQESAINSHSHQNKVYKCALCSFQTVDLKIMNDHKCSSVISKRKDSASKQMTRTPKVATRKQSSQDKQARLYCCMSCSFKTKTLRLVQSHRCRESKTINNKLPPVVLNKKTKFNVEEGLEQTPNIEHILNNLDNVLASPVAIKKIEDSVFVCQICKQTFSRKYLLFHHLRHIHFGVRRVIIFGCCFCNYYVENVQTLKHHLQVKHRSPTEKDRVICKELYMCTPCNMRTDKFQNIKMHFDSHIKSYESIMKITHQRDHELSTIEDAYECILCGEHSNSINAWLVHECKDTSQGNLMAKPQEPPKTDNKYKCILCRKGNNTSCLTHKCKDEEKLDVSQRRKRREAQRSFHTDTGKRTYRRRCTKSPKDLCYHCKTQVIGAAVKCSTYDCDNWYHLKCVDLYGKLMDSPSINYRYNWFCIQCIEDIVPVQDEVGTISWCMELSDKEYMLELEKHKSMVNELKKIKTEKVKMKEDFDRIKKFIVECQSERINNAVVKSVCTIVESFINAGADTNE